MKSLKTALWICALAAGLAGCSEDKEKSEGTEPIYGVPTITFSIRGHVSNYRGQRIEGINVKFRNDAETYTDENGIFEFSHCQTFGTGGEQFGEYLVFRDVDGAENGSYKAYKTYAVFDRQDNVKFGGNYYGDYRAPETGIALQDKTEETEETEE